MPRANARDFLNCRVVIPSLGVLKHFEQFLVPGIFKEVRSVSENVELGNARDSLFPKLLAGQLTIPDAEKLVADAL